MSMPDFEDKVMGAVSRPEYRPMTVKALSRALEIEAGDYPEFRKAARRLVKQGKLVVAKDKTIEKTTEAARKKSSNAIIGTFRRTSKGFGFVRPMGATDRLDHIFISPHFELQHVTVVRNDLTRISSDHLPLVADLRIVTAGVDTSTTTPRRSAGHTPAALPVGQR